MGQHHSDRDLSEVGPVSGVGTSGAGIEPDLTVDPFLQGGQQGSGVGCRVRDRCLCAHNWLLPRLHRFNHLSWAQFPAVGTPQAEPVRTLSIMGLADRTVTAQLLIKADAATIYDLLADPANHASLDGSGMLAGRPRGSSRLTVGDRFTMGMRQGPARYRSVNTVVEADPGRAIAWQTVGEWRGRRFVGGQVWRYQLRPFDEGDPGRGTVVRHTYDWSAAVLPRLTIEVPRFPQRMARTMPESLERLRRAVTSPNTAA